MKHLMNSKLLAGLLLAIAFALVGSVGCTGAGVQEQKQIATACAGITAAGNVIAGNAEAAPAGEAKVKAKAIAAKALVIAKPTKTWCEPKPVDHLNPADYAALLSAAADLATLKKESVQ